MKYFLAMMLLFGSSSALLAVDGVPDGEFIEEQVQNDNDMLLQTNGSMRISVVGQGVAPTFTTSPAQAYALAKRAAMVEGYRLIAERVNGVQIEGQDTVKNMMVQRTNIRVNVSAMIRNAQVVETTFKDGMCEVEMEIVLSHAQFN